MKNQEFINGNKDDVLTLDKIINIIKFPIAYKK